MNQGKPVNGASLSRLTFLVVLILTAGELHLFSQTPAITASAARDVLRSSKDRDALESAAVALIRTEVRQDLSFVGQLLRDAEFLSRLDDFNDLKTLHLGRVLEALAEHPSAQAAELCLTLADAPAYSDDDDRQRFLLKVLAAVKPMSEGSVRLFQRTNAEGYFIFNASLLAANGSPRALSLFESMMLDRDVPVSSRVDALHIALVPGRTQLPMLQMADRILSRNKEEQLSNGLIESIFDFRLWWFGTDSRISAPSWSTASVNSLRFAARMADVALARRDLTSELRPKVSQSREAILRILGGQ